MSTPTERGDLAERMLPVAAQLACIVHGEGGQQDIAHVLDQLDRTELVALIVDLAAMVDPDQNVADVLAHVDYDEAGRPAPALLNHRTIRQIARIQWTPIDGDPRTEARRLLRRGLRAEQIAERIGVTSRTVYRWQAAWGEAA